MHNQKEQLKMKIDNLNEKDISMISSQVDSLAKNNSVQDFKLGSQLDEIKIQNDLFGRSFFAKSLAGIMKEDVVPPYTIGIYGKWGSGKSVFLDFLNQSLDSQYFTVVNFNAWKYENTGNVMYSLYKQIESLLPSGDKKNKKYKELGRGLLRLGSNLEVNPYGINLKFGVFYKLISLFSNSFEEIVNDNYETITLVKKNFSNQVQDVLNSHKKKVMVIMVDDLDRCNPENVVRILESIKNYLSTSNCIFVVAVDKDVVASGIKHKYANSPFISGEEYLDKIINWSTELNLTPEHGIQNLVDMHRQNFIKILGDHKLSLLVTAYKLLGCQSIRSARKILDKFTVYMKNPATLTNFRSEIILFVIILQELLPNFYSDIKKYSHLRFVDNVLSRHLPDRNTDLTKLSESEVRQYEYVKKQELRDLIGNFKALYFNDPDAANKEINSEVIRAIKYIESMIIGVK